MNLNNKFSLVNQKEVPFKEHKDNSESNDIPFFFYEEGNKHYNRKNYDIAMMYYNRALEHEKMNKMFYYQRSLCLMQRGEYMQSLRDALRCIELDSSFIKVSHTN